MEKKHFLLHIFIVCEACAGGRSQYFFSYGNTFQSEYVAAECHKCMVRCDFYCVRNGGKFCLEKTIKIKFIEIIMTLEYIKGMECFSLSRRCMAC